ncbi:PTS lactose/cellobiose transporter subunit IIA [Clostridium fallax]|uniref:PTS system lactose-specific EIIA component n=1 Tax=Clostridium fallax TaxID=1533 RepID=A0A1M4VJX9_9CLOT|nr:PTS lactose/cellobiose transporter subunit IIA [Clostridium fallax]SHE69294.1 PTS system lactose-specific IIA component, Lac family [Clostridium fallax]SQB22761.1 PTS system lactose-specific transporter subunit IIA [Clostridium fallax]
MDRADIKFNSKEMLYFTTNARKKYIEALDKCEKGDFDKAEILIGEGNDCVEVAQKIKEKIFYMDDNEEKVPEIFMMVSAQDSLESVLLIKDLIKHFINLYKFTQS